jgi:hypothetical protein
MNLSGFPLVVLGTLMVVPDSAALQRLPTAMGHGGRGPVSFQKFVIFLFDLGWR